jgi:hypothetical protein
MMNSSEMVIGNAEFGVENVYETVLSSTTLIPVTSVGLAVLVVLDRPPHCPRGVVIARLHSVLGVVAELGRELDVLRRERLAVRAT